MTTPATPGRFGQDYYQREFGLDQLRRFNMHWWSVRFYALIARRLLRRRRGRRMLDIGCAHGYTLAWLADEFETFGVDVSEYAIGRARELTPRSQVFVADVQGEWPDPILAGGFDLVLAKYVLEHLPRPAEVLARIASVLRPGGVLVFSVPDTTSPGRRFKGPNWFGLRDETHVSLLAPEEWLELTRRAGLRVERTFSDGLWDVPYVRWAPRLLQYPLFSLPMIVSVLLARPMIPAGRGENLIVIAQRPPGAADDPPGGTRR